MNGLYIRPARWPAPMTVSSIPWHLDAATVSVLILTAPHLVIISNKYIYAYSKGARSNTLVRFDLEKKEWECLYRNFWGRLAPGVVLYGDSYLVCFGTKKPTCNSLFSQQPGLYVFDIHQRQWLDEPVKGLDDAIPVIPEGFEEDPVYDYFLPLLFQIGTERFALVWDDYLENVGCELHCHKFTLDYTPSSGSNCTTEKNQQPTSFVARRLSNGVLIQQDGTLLGCTVGMHDRGTDTPVTAATDRERERLYCRVGAGGGEGLGGSGLVGAPGWLNCLRALFGLAHGVVRGDGGGGDAVT
ncbi:hypothetical protein ACLB2K_022367 [Fragaria x ananassa]